MDRNKDQFDVAMSSAVALRKESVDRNPVLGWRLTACPVALRKESVDRNYYCDHDTDWIRSLSARRAWIEMSSFQRAVNVKTVALRKESVDRNWLRRLCGVQL